MVLKDTAASTLDGDLKKLPRFFLTIGECKR
jgi:hypothetical protein